MNEEKEELSLGSTVLVSGLRKLGTLIALAKNGKARVLVEGKEIFCHKDLLSLTPLSATKKGAKKKMIKLSAAKSAALYREAIFSVDLHGFRADTVERACEEALNAALLAHSESLEIVHGHGKGIVKKLVWEYFSNNKFVKRMRVHPMNSGVTQVYI